MWTCPKYRLLIRTLRRPMTIKSHLQTNYGAISCKLTHRHRKNFHKNHSQFQRLHLRHSSLKFSKKHLKYLNARSSQMISWCLIRAQERMIVTTSKENQKHVNLQVSQIKLKIWNVAVVMKKMNLTFLTRMKILRSKWSSTISQRNSHQNAATSERNSRHKAAIPLRKSQK